MNGIYFSGTGNTKYCLEKFCKATGGKAISIEDPAALKIIEQNETLAVGHPIYYSDIPPIMRDFIKTHADLFCGKKIFILATMGLFSGDGAGVSGRLLKKCGAVILGGLHVRMPDCIGDEKMLKKPLAVNLKLIHNTEEKIEASVQKIQLGKYPKDGLHFYSRICGLFGQRLWFKATAKGLTKKLKINSDKCIGCGMCSTNCPVKAISLRNKKAVFTGTCGLCYRCINSCPQKAITLIGKEVIEQCLLKNYLSV